MAEFGLTRPTDTIRQPGKFEGETLVAPYYHEAMMDGCPEPVYDGDDVIDTFDVTDEDREILGELLAPEDAHVVLETSGSGFVQASILTAPDFARWIATLDDGNDDETAEG